uniref:Uncharacterized protein n=2 Tax=Aegilops tauschii TaxID=37682 RepID=A0A453DTT2_AEGTS
HRLVVIWALVEEDGATSMWEPRYTLYLMNLLHPLAFLPGPGTLLLWYNGGLCLYNLQSRELTNACELSRLRYLRHGSGELERDWKDVHFFNVIPYTESLVSVGAHPA